MLCWNRHKVGDPEKYKINGEWMQMQPEVKKLLMGRNAQFVKNSNGVGSRVGFWNKLIYHVIPDSIGFLNITGPSDLHDNGFSVPIEFKTLSDAYQYFEEVNWNFLSNLRREILNGTYTRWIRKSRYFVAAHYYDAVQSSVGWTSFMDGKLIGGCSVSTDEVDAFYNSRNPQQAGLK
jgi:hypothetical protein